MDARTSKEVWAVGVRSDDPFLLRWNGEKWTQTTPPHGLPSPTYSTRVVGIGPSNAYMVAYGFGSSGRETVALHFDGSDWTRE